MSIVLALLVLGASGIGQDTGWLNPSADSGDFIFGWRAYYDDNQSALISAYWDELSHIFWGYSFPLPASVVVQGIEVRLDAWSWPKGWWEPLSLRVELSWDGGANWTLGYETGPLPFSQTTVVLGGPTDGWGRRWRGGELNPMDFRVRLWAHGSGRLDWVAVRVYFASEAPSLEVTPSVIGFGTLTLEDYDRGYRDWADLQGIKLSAPADWILSIAAKAPVWTYAGDLPDPKKPCGHLLWRVESWQGSVSTANGVFTPLSTTDNIMAQGPAGSATLAVSFRLLVDYDTTWPGTYSLDFRYTLTSP
ncbi:MAG: hypothetical protein ACP5JD_02230 [Candidatus Bipolaricaulaceae bacterium]